MTRDSGYRAPTSGLREPGIAPFAHAQQNYPNKPITFIIGFALTPQTELYVRQTVILYSDRPFDLMVGHPIVVFFVALTLYSLFRIGRYQRAMRRQRIMEAALSSEPV